MNRVRWCLFVIFLAALGLPVSAATIQGTVRDPSGALVAGAGVTISSTASETRSTKTDAQGHFSIDGVPSGEYQIAVQEQGFENAQRTVTVGKEPKVDVDIQLNIQAQETVVEVSGKRSPLANSDPNYRTLRDAGVTEVIRIENVTLKRDAGELRLRSGLVGFLPPVLGRIAIAVFSGQASFHLEPAFSLEANYLQMLTDKKTVDEEFDSAVLCFSDATYEELKREGSAAQSTNALTDSLHDFHHRMRHRNETPRSMLEAMLTYDEIPNVEAELLAELYNSKSQPSFSAYIHGHRYHDLRFLIEPRGAMRQLPSPEEVGLIHLDPLGTHEGIFYLTHLKSEWQNVTASSKEDKRIAGLKHYRIDTAIARSGRLTAAADVTFEAMRDGDRIIDFGLLPTLRVTRVAAGDGKAIGFIQEDRKEDGSFYALLPQPTVKGQPYTLHIEYEGNKVIENAGNGSFSVGARTSWYPSLNSFNDRATFDLIFRVPKQYMVVGVGKLVKQ